MGGAACVEAQGGVGDGGFFGTDQAGALGIQDFGVGEAGADAVQHRDRRRRFAVIVADQGVEAVGIGTDDGDGLRLIQRQQVVVVLQQDHRLARHVGGDVVVGGGVVIGRLDGREDVLGRVEQAELDARHEQARRRLIDGRLAHQALFDGGDDVVGLGRHIVAVVAADDVHAGLERQGDAFGGGFGVVQGVGAVDVGGGAAVRHDIALEAPVLAQMGLQQVGVGAGRDVVDRIIGAHDGIDVGFGDRGAEGRQVGVFEIVRRRADVGLMSGGFGAGVDGEVFRGGDGLVIVRIVALQAFDEGDAHAAGQVRVFAVGFLAAAPARVAEDVDVG